jgi:hypothetical protein
MLKTDKQLYFNACNLPYYKPNESLTFRARIDYDAYICYSYYTEDEINNFLNNQYPKTR